MPIATLLMVTEMTGGDQLLVATALAVILRRLVPDLLSSSRRPVDAGCLPRDLHLEAGDQSVAIAPQSGWERLSGQLDPVRRH